MYKSVLIVLSVIIVFSLTSCMGTVTESKTGEGTTTNAPTTTTTAAPKNDINPLTGLADIKIGNSVRPVCIMIGNNERSRPQIGIDKADLYVEAETEGGITRIMSVFSGVSRVPGKIGPIRSARTPFILIAESLGSVYCHAGGSRTGLALLKNSEVGNIDALFGINNSAFWRDAGLKNSKGLEYSMMTSGDRLNARIKAFKFSEKTDKPSPFTFGQSPAGSGAGQNVQVKMSGLQTVSFRYHADSKLYDKINGTLSNGTVHKTMDGTAIKVSSILIMYDEKYSENERTIGFRLQSGTGLLVTQGTSKQIRWSRTKGSLKFTNYDGSVLIVPSGKPYICLTDVKNAAQTVVS